VVCGIVFITIQGVDETATVFRSQRQTVRFLTAGTAYSSRWFRNPSRKIAAVDLQAHKPHIGSVSLDISKILNQWEFRPGQILVRKFKGDDEVEKIQLRLDLGVLQMNASGRPDGSKPRGFETFYDYCQAQCKKAKISHGSGEIDFNLSEENCSELHMEAMQYYHRSLCHLQLNDYPAAIHDTGLNLEISDFLNDHAESEEIVTAFFQFRPQVLMIKTRAEGALALEGKQFVSAVSRVKAGIDEIRSFYEEYTDLESPDSTQEIQSLQSWLEEIEVQRPVTEREKLDKELAAAIRDEEYEKAAQLRDAIKKLEP
jgi:hypothetical protein